MQALTQRTKHCILCDQTLCPTYKGGGHAAILHTILCNYTILATQRGGHGPMPPLNTPLLVQYGSRCEVRKFWTYRTVILAYSNCCLSFLFLNGLNFWWTIFVDTSFRLHCLEALFQSFYVEIWARNAEAWMIVKFCSEPSGENDLSTITPCYSCMDKSQGRIYGGGAIGPWPPLWVARIV